MPEPILEEDQGGISVTFLKDIYTEEYLKRLEINARQIQAILFIKQTGHITNRQYQIEYNVSDRTALRDLNDLVGKNILMKMGDKKGSHYTLKRQK